MKYKNYDLKISCDGGASTGKSTGAKIISKKFKLRFLSSGLLYRYASFLLLRHKPRNKINFLRSKFKKLNYTKLEKINLQTPEISNYSSIIAKRRDLREILKKYQINFSKKNRNCCIEGRDISTKILPGSDIKFYFICNINIAAYRRYKDLKKRGIKIKLAEVKKALKLRNISDKKRKHSPLKKHKNAVVVNTGKLSKKAMIKQMSNEVKKVLKSKYGY